MRKNIFKVGERVKISSLEGKGGYPFGVNSSMLDLVGSIVTIASITLDVYDPERYIGSSLDGCRYKIKEDEHYWSWNSGFFVPLTKPTIF